MSKPLKLAGQVTGHVERLSEADGGLSFDLVDGARSVAGTAALKWRDALSSGGPVRARGAVSWERDGKTFRAKAVEAAECAPATFDLGGGGGA